MIAGWMLYGVLVSALLLGAGVLLEAAARRVRLPLRGVWAGAMAGSVVLPLLALRPAAPLPERTVVEGAGVFDAVMLDPLQVVAPGGWDLLGMAEPFLLTGWAAGTVLLLAVGGAGFLRLRRAMAGWETVRERRPRVLLAPDTGPAVLGFFPGVVVLPRWSSAGDRRLMLTHEAEHLRAGDPALLLAAHLLVALFPWNLPLWWQLGRLRLAVEMDCDARVLGRNRDLRSYATLLLSVGERRSGLQPALVPFAEPASSLERRIRIMISDRARKGWMASLAMAAMAAVLLLAACQADAPTAGPAEESASASPDEGPVDVYPTPEEQQPGRVVEVDPGEIAVAGPEREAPPPPRERARSQSAAAAEGQFAYEAAVLQRQPELRNGTELQDLMQRLYPRLLLDANIGGRVVLEFVIQPDGTVDRSSIKVVEATHDQFEEVSSALVERFQFRPGQYNNRDVRVLVRMPVTWQPPR